MLRECRKSIWFNFSKKWIYITCCEWNENQQSWWDEINIGMTHSFSLSKFTNLNFDSDGSDHSIHVKIHSKVNTYIDHKCFHWCHCNGNSIHAKIHSITIHLFNSYQVNTYINGKCFIYLIVMVQFKLIYIIFKLKVYSNLEK